MTAPSTMRLKVFCGVDGWMDKLKNDKDNQDAMHKNIAPGQLVEQFGVPRRIFDLYLDGQISQAESCRSIPFTLLLVISYACVVITHDNAPATIAVERSATRDIIDNANFAYVEEMGFKNVYDVNRYVDFWSWMSKGLVPLLFTPQVTLSSGANHPNGNDIVWNASARHDNSSANLWTPGVFLNYNRIVGGLRLSQERFEGLGYDCNTHPGLLKTYGITCRGGFSYELDPEVYEAQYTAEVKRKRVEWLYMEDSIDSIQRQVFLLEKQGWLDVHTMKVELAIPVYNAEYGIHALIQVNFFFSRGGHIWKAVIPLSNYANWQDTYVKIFVEVILCGCLLWMIYGQVRSVYRQIRRKGVMRCVVTYFSPWIVLEWLSVLLAGGVIIMFAFTISKSGTLNTALEDLGNVDDRPEVAIVGRDEVFRALFLYYFACLEDAVYFTHKFTIMMATFPLVVLFRIFRAFSAQPRLAVVTQTLMAASVDLFHFMIVFISIIGTFSIFGVVLFGSSIDEFATFSRTIQTLFLATMNVFDWQQLKVIGGYEAGLFLWSFMGIVSLVLLNMFLAIVMDAYERSKDQGKNSLTLWAEMIVIAQRAYAERYGDRVTFKDLRKALDAEVTRLVMEEQKKKEEEGSDDEDDEEQISRHKKNRGVLHMLRWEILVDCVPNMTEAQARDVLMQAAVTWYKDMAKEISFEEFDDRVLELGSEMNAWEEVVMMHPDDVAQMRPNDVTRKVKQKVDAVSKKLQAALDAPDERPKEVSVEEVKRRTLLNNGPGSRTAQLQSEIAVLRAQVNSAMATIKDYENRLSQVEGSTRKMKRYNRKLQDRADALKEENRALKNVMVPAQSAKDPAAEFDEGAEVFREQLMADRSVLHQQLAIRAKPDSK